MRIPPPRRSRPRYIRMGSPATPFEPSPGASGTPGKWGSPGELRSAAGRAEAPLAAGGVAEVGGLLQRRGFDSHDHELGDAVADGDVEGDVRVGVQKEHAQLAAVARVDQ